MLSSFNIKNFRCFKDFSISPLERINLITGVNNVGKTTLLEGMFLFAGATNPKLAMNINAFRGIEVVEVKTDLQSETPWNSIFYNLDEQAEITMCGEIDSLKQRKLIVRVKRKESELIMKDVSVPQKNGFILSETTGKILEFEYIDETDKTIRSSIIVDSQRIHFDLPPIPSPFSAIFLASNSRNLGEDTQRFSNIEISGQQGVLLKILNIIEPRLKRLTVAVTAGVPMIYGDIGLNRLLPLGLMGQGLVRVCSIVLAIASLSNGIVFIDEIENGVHYSIMENIWLGIAEAARQFNTQIFATTHSKECITAAHNAFSQSLIYDFLLHRLDKNRTGDNITAKTYDRETLSAAINTDLEVR